MNTDLPSRKPNSVKRTVGTMVMVVIAMFGFGYALVPLYDVFCDITGLGGRTGRVEAQAAERLDVDRSRVITVQFIASVNGSLPWEFGPRVKSMQVHPGEVADARYYAINRADDTVIAQAIPSVTPARAAKYFSKVECFCFNNQPLAASEEAEMPVRFMIDPRLPEEIETVTLSYTFFDTGSTDTQGGGQGRIRTTTR